MKEPRRCRVTSPATARRCTLGSLHESEHERRGRSGRLLERWPRSPSDVDHTPACTQAELLEHLADLIDLAKSEGFGRIVGALARARTEIAGARPSDRRRRRARPSKLFGWDRGPSKFTPRRDN